MEHAAAQADPSKKPHYDLPRTIHTEPPKVSLPAEGMSRWNDIAKFVPFGREKFRQLVRAGKAPQGISLSQRCTVYKNQELHKFFADPANYSAQA